MPWVADISISMHVRIWWLLMGRMTPGFTPGQMSFCSLMPVATSTRSLSSMLNGMARRARQRFRNACANIWPVQVGRMIGDVQLSSRRNWKIGCGRTVRMFARLWGLAARFPSFVPLLKVRVFGDRTRQNQIVQRRPSNGRFASPEREGHPRSISNWRHGSLHEGVLTWLFTLYETHYFDGFYLPNERPSKFRDDPESGAPLASNSTRKRCEA